ncbi:MAG: nucleotidyltransferase domain-containing protein [candidate division Zixibacteria bacterium]|nr:nucleotidyltransferase domain-containing protein [candidate division Zixibacteria bacterium]
MVADEKLRGYILKLVEKIRKEYRPEKIILFGSYAYGKPTRDSDIDLLIIKETDERPIDRRVRMRRIVDIREPISFSPIVVTPEELAFRLKKGDQFFKEILNKGETLYAR